MDEDDWRTVEPPLARRLLELADALERHIDGGPFLMLSGEARPIVEALDDAAAELERQHNRKTGLDSWGRPLRPARSRRRDKPGQQYLFETTP